MGLSGCGSGAAPPPPTPDFSLSISPSSVAAQVGTITTPVTVTVNVQTGFSSSVDITLPQLPQGVAPLPSSSFTLMPGASQVLTFSVADFANVGTSPLIVRGTSSTKSHQAQIMLTAQAIVCTYQIGSVLYLESGTATDTARIGLETAWGGSIVEVSVNGTNYVNAPNTGLPANIRSDNGVPFASAHALFS